MKKYWFLILSLLSLSCSKEEVSYCENQDICEMSVYPIPFSNEVTMDLLSDVTDRITIQFYSIRGQKVSYQRHQLRRGKNSFLTNLDTLRSGVYFFQATSARDTLTGRVLKE